MLDTHHLKCGAFLFEWLPVKTQAEITAIAAIIACVFYVLSKIEGKITAIAVAFASVIYRRSNIRRNERRCRMFYRMLRRFWAEHTAE